MKTTENKKKLDLSLNLVTRKKEKLRGKKTSLNRTQIDDVIEDSKARTTEFARNQSSVF